MNQNAYTRLFIQENASKMVSAKWQPFWSGLSVLKILIKSANQANSAALNSSSQECIDHSWTKID